ncbi:MAG: MBL fold metallo-hydrolase [Candidatus Korarchaeota archaeon]|nr:MBL fold metallo-hydrolase [Candidatus Korarchaeota archaeon]
MFEIGPVKIYWLGHAAFRVRDSVVIYVDPYEIAGGEEADLILITHDHFDHCSPDDAAKVAHTGTRILGTSLCLKKLESVPGEKIEISPGREVEVSGVKVRAVPAYNVRPERRKFHPRDKGYVGYVFELDGIRIYHAGDTDFIPEMADLEVDVALLPVSGTYVMDAEEAARAAAALRPRVVIPMHYGSIVGSERDARHFAELVEGCEVVVLEPEN